MHILWKEEEISEILITILLSPVLKSHCGVKSDEIISTWKGIWSKFILVPVKTEPSGLVTKSLKLHLHHQNNLYTNNRTFARNKMLSVD